MRLQELADSAGLSHSFITRIEKDERTTSRHFLVKVAAALELNGYETARLLVAGGFWPYSTDLTLELHTVFGWKAAHPAKVRSGHATAGKSALEPDQMGFPFTHALWSAAKARKIYYSALDEAMGYGRARISSQISQIRHGKWAWTWGFGRRLIHALTTLYPDLRSEREWTALLAAELGDRELFKLLEPSVPSIVASAPTVQPIRFRPTDWSHEPAFAGVSSAL